MLAALYAAFVAAGFLVAVPWFFGGYLQERQNQALGTAVFGFVLAVCANRVWFLMHVEMGHRPSEFSAHPMPQVLTLVSIAFLLAMAWQCHWLDGRWWVVVSAAAVAAFGAAQAV